MVIVVLMGPFRLVILNVVVADVIMSLLFTIVRLTFAMLLAEPIMEKDVAGIVIYLLVSVDVPELLLMGIVRQIVLFVRKRLKFILEKADLMLTSSAQE